MLGIFCVSRSTCVKHLHAWWDRTGGSRLTWDQLVMLYFEDETPTHKFKLRLASYFDAEFAWIRWEKERVKRNIFLITLSPNKAITWKLHRWKKLNSNSCKHNNLQFSQFNWELAKFHLIDVGHFVLLLANANLSTH